MLERQKTHLTYGTEPGLRFALLLDGKGGCTPLTMSGLSAWTPAEGAVWFHFERDHPATVDWVTQRGDFDQLVAEALVEEDSRPRVEPIDDGLLIILRGLCATPPEEAEEKREDIDLVPVHMWVDENRLESLRDSGHYLTALRDIRQALEAGKGPRSTGELLALVSEKLVRDLEPVLDQMDEECDELDDLVFEGNAGEVRERLKQLRRRSVQLKRYLAPQRDALSRIEHDDAPWLTGRDKLRMREVIDKLLRFIDYPDSIRDRTGILHDDLSTVISERIAHNSNRLAALAALLLPPSLVAGLFGMDVGGIPGVHDGYAFIAVVVFVLLMSALTLVVLRRINWL